jgi:hypothetical protein
VAPCGRAPDTGPQLPIDKSGRGTGPKSVSLTRRPTLAELNAVTFRASGTATGAPTSGNARSLARTAPGFATASPSGINTR